MSKIRNPLGAVDQKVLSIVGNGDVTAAQIRAAHKQAFGTESGASACIVRFDRAGRLRTAAGELGSRGREAADRAAALAALPPGESLPPRAPRAPRTPKTVEVPRAGSAAIKEEYERLRKLNPFVPRGELAARAEDNLAAAYDAAVLAANPPRAPRAPADPLRLTDPRVRAALEEATAEGPIDRAGLRIIHAAAFGDRPDEPGEARDAWDHRFDLCVPRLRRAKLLLSVPRPPKPTFATVPGFRAAPGESEASYAARLGVRGEHAPRPTDIDGNEIPLFASRSERAPRAPVDPLRKTDPRVREFLTAAGDPVDRAGLRLIHEEIFGPRPTEKGEARDAWEKNFDRCIPRLQRAKLLIVKERDPEAAQKNKVRAAFKAADGSASGAAFALGVPEATLLRNVTELGLSLADLKRVSGSREDARIMREARGELSCLRKHAISVAKIDADSCPIGKSKAAGDAARAEKVSALKALDSLWGSVMKSGSPSEVIRLLDEAADLVGRSFPGNRYDYEGQAAGVLHAALGGAAPAAAAE